MEDAVNEVETVVESWQQPDYADPAKFEERDVTVGSGEFAVPGTLSLPRGAGPHPAVVLLSGGGPFDRDSTVGPNKPFKDIAWALAGRGIAVLRFDKATNVHAEKFWMGAEPTPTAEYVPHTVAAVEILCGLTNVDENRVFVLGHSMGGTMSPRVMAAEPRIAGAVILAGETEPMQWALVRVARILAEIDPASIAALPPIETLIEQAKLVDSEELSLSTPPGDLPFGMPPAYWLDLRAYDPVAVASTLDKPMLILQGERDYQVTVADDLIGWQNGLGDRSDVTIRIYPADDHMFVAGQGQSTTADYMRPQHIDAEVIGDIADWLTQVR